MTTAALQLFAHLDGEALQVALLMLDKIRERWKDLVDILSAYYYTPGRLAVVRRQFENVCRRPGLDPATFATELGILALRGFADMKEKARDLMIRNRTSHTERSRSCEIAPEHYSRTVARKRVGIYVAGYASCGISHGRKDISTGDSTSRGGGGGAFLLTNDLWKRDQCFSCGLHGHGVNRCSRLDISFPYILPGWSVDVRNGQYRASRMRGDGQDRRRGKEGWFGREGQPPRPSMIVTHLTQVGLRKNEVIARFWMVAIEWWHGIRRWNRSRVRSRMAPLGPNVGVPRRGMRPAGVSGPAQQMAPVGVRDVKGRSAVRLLSVEAVEFSPTLDPEMNVMSGRKTVSSRAGGVAPAVVADVPIPTEAGVTFLAVAEVHASASVIEDDILVVQASEQRTVCSIVPGRVPETLSVPAGDTLVAEPLKHSAQKIDLDGTPMEEIVVLEPLALLVPDVSLDSRPMAGKMDRKPLEHAVSEEDRTGRPMEGAFGPEPLEHSVLKIHLDSRPGRNELTRTVRAFGSIPCTAQRCCFFVKVRQCRTRYSIRVYVRVVIQCRSRHRRSLQSIRRRLDPNCGEKDYCQRWTQRLIRNLQAYRESPRSHNGWRTHSGRTSRGPLGLGWRLVRLL